MKKLFVIAALACAVVAGPAFAGPVVSGEFREGTNSGPSGFDFQYSDTVGPVAVGAEVETFQPNNAGPVANLYSLSVGTALPQVLGFKTVVSAQGGTSESTGNDFNFWGANVAVSHAIVGNVTGEVAYRYRTGFDTGKLKEERLSATAKVALTKSTDLGVTYYRYMNDLSHVDGNVVGLGLVHKF
jgi:hypothetical protein